MKEINAGCYSVQNQSLIKSDELTDQLFDGVTDDSISFVIRNCQHIKQIKINKEIAFNITILVLLLTHQIYI
jgi:hypothetical protein